MQESKRRLDIIESYIRSHTPYEVLAHKYIYVWQIKVDSVVEYIEREGSLDKISGIFSVFSVSCAIYEKQGLLLNHRSAR
jgi:hypothetical protein